MKFESEKWLEINIGFEHYTPGLTRVKSVIKLLPIKFSSKKIITIAGTNGKGECARTIFKEIKERYSCALFTSPHIHSVHERFQNSLGQIKEDQLIDTFQTVQSYQNEAMVQLTYYEFLFVAFLLFAKDSEILVLEVGLGGRLDAVNSVDADIVLISSISRDHQEYLGNSFKKILNEKCGVLRDKCLLYSALELKYLQAELKEICSKMSIQHIDLFENQVLSLDDHFSKRNQSLVSTMLKNEFNINREVNTGLPCSDICVDETRFMIFSSHNIDGVRKSVQLMPIDQYNFDKVLIYLSERSINDARVILKILKCAYAKTAHLHMVSFDHPKAMVKEKLRKLSVEFEIKVVNDFKEVPALFKSRQVLCIGSHYSMHELMSKLKSLRSG